MTSSCVRGGLDQILEKSFFRKRHQALEEVAKGSGGITNPWKGLKGMWTWHLRIRFTSEHGGAGLMFELDDCGGLFQP